MSTGADGRASRGRAARRRARALPPPLPQREGLDPVRWVVGPQQSADSQEGADSQEDADPQQGPADSSPPQDAQAVLPRTAHAALLARFPAIGAPGATPLAERFARGEILRDDGTAWAAQDPVRSGDAFWFHRELREEHVPEMPLRILHRDQQLLILDKPHDMATMPRGAHVLSSALVRLRRATGITTLVPLHRLDRRTAGVLAFGIVPAQRAAYQGLFAGAQVEKEYLARVERAGERAPSGEGEPEAPTVGALTVGARFIMCDRLVKRHGELTARIEAGEPNALTEVEVLEQAADGSLLLRLRPRTGRTHQLRAQLSSRGLPIVGEDLYPRPRPAPSTALQLVARSLAFTDPITGQEHSFVSAMELDLPGSRPH